MAETPKASWKMDHGPWNEFCGSDLEDMPELRESEVRPYLPSLRIWGQSNTMRTERAQITSSSDDLHIRSQETQSDRFSLLPTEILHYIFVLSGNPELLLASKTLKNLLLTDRNLKEVIINTFWEGDLHGHSNPWHKVIYTGEALTCSDSWAPSHLQWYSGNVQDLFKRRKTMQKRLFIRSWVTADLILEARYELIHRTLRDLVSNWLVHCDEKGVRSCLEAVHQRLDAFKDKGTEWGRDLSVIVIRRSDRYEKLAIMIGLMDNVPGIELKFYDQCSRNHQRLKPQIQMYPPLWKQHLNADDSKPQPTRRTQRLEDFLWPPVHGIYHFCKSTETVCPSRQFNRDANKKLKAIELAASRQRQA